MDTFLSMGGYAGFVWPSYGLAVLVLVAILASSVRAVRAGESKLASIQTSRRARRGGQPE